MSAHTRLRPIFFFFNLQLHVRKISRTNWIFWNFTLACSECIIYFGFYFISRFRGRMGFLVEGCCGIDNFFNKYDRFDGNWSINRILRVRKNIKSDCSVWSNSWDTKYFMENGCFHFSNITYRGKSALDSGDSDSAKNFISLKNY